MMSNQADTVTRWLLGPAAAMLLAACLGDADRPDRGELPPGQPQASAPTRGPAAPLGPHPDAARLAASQPAQAAPGGEGPVQAPPGPPTTPPR